MRRHVGLAVVLSVVVWVGAACSGAGPAAREQGPEEKDLPEICRVGGWERHRAARAVVAPDAGPQAPAPPVEALPREVVQTVINRHLAKIRSCYEAEYVRNRKLLGHLLVDFTIHSSGAVREVNVAEDSLGSTAVRDCVVTRVRVMSFPPFTEGQKVEVSYPFLFCGYGVTPRRSASGT